MTDVVHPQSNTDPFCTCPRCLCLGTHLVERAVHRTEMLDLGDGATVEIVGWGDPPDGTPMVYRTCPFCGFVWRRRAEAAPAEGETL